MALKLVIGVHLCDKSDFYLIKGASYNIESGTSLRYDAIKVLDLGDFSVHDISLEDCHKLGYKHLSFSDMKGVGLSDNYIVGSQGIVIRDSTMAFVVIKDKYSYDIPLYYKGELIQYGKTRIYNLFLSCCNELRPSVKFPVNFYIDLIDYTVQCFVCGKQVCDGSDLKCEYMQYSSRYKYYSDCKIDNNILFPSLSETISDGICTFGNRLAVVSLLGDGNYIVPNNVEFVSIRGSGKSNIVIPPSVKRVYIDGDAKCSYINFSLSSNVSNMFLRELYSKFLGINGDLFGRKEILEAFSKLEGINIGFY